MMLQRLGIAQFIGCLIDYIEEATGIRCYDYPDNVESPLFSVEVASTTAANTKTMYIDVFNVNLHCISEPVEPYSNAPVLGLVQTLQEVMTDRFELPEPFSLYRLDFSGLQTLKRDESGEGHAILTYQFYICYGFRCK